MTEVSRRRLIGISHEYLAELLHLGPRTVVLEAVVNHRDGRVELVVYDPDAPQLKEGERPILESLGSL